jgi:hypothetical protein
LTIDNYQLKASSGLHSPVHLVYASAKLFAQEKQGDAMIQPILRIVLLLVIGLLPTGCNLGPWGGPAYTLDPFQIGSGQQAIVPRNDSWFSSGEQMDYRRGH